MNFEGGDSNNEPKKRYKTLHEIRFMYRHTKPIKMSRAIKALTQVALLDSMTLKMLLDDYNKQHGGEEACSQTSRNPYSARSSQSENSAA